MTFVDGSTVINADKMNGIVSKINELITAVNSGSTPVQETVATPVISISGNTATITCATAGATIYYTTNGNTPTSSSTSGTSPVTVNLTQSCTIKAIALKSGMTNSLVASQSYTAPSVTVAAPTINIAITDTGNSVSMNAESGTTIYYTVDGSTPVPGQSGTLQYTTAFSLSATTTVKAIAVKIGSSSAISSKTYTKTIITPSSVVENARVRETGSGQGSITGYTIIRFGYATMPQELSSIKFTKPVLSGEKSGYYGVYSGTTGTLNSENCLVVHGLENGAETPYYDGVATLVIPEGGTRCQFTVEPSIAENFEAYYETVE